VLRLHLTSNDLLKTIIQPNSLYDRGYVGRAVQWCGSVASQQEGFRFESQRRPLCWNLRVFSRYSGFLPKTCLLKYYPPFDDLISDSGNKNTWLSLGKHMVWAAQWKWKKKSFFFLNESISHHPSYPVSAGEPSYFHRYQHIVLTHNMSSPYHHLLRVGCAHFTYFFETNVCLFT